MQKLAYPTKNSGKSRLKASPVIVVLQFRPKKLQTTIYVKVQLQSSMNFINHTVLKV